MLSNSHLNADANVDYLWIFFINPQFQPSLFFVYTVPRYVKKPPAVTHGLIGTETPGISETSWYHSQTENWQAGTDNAGMTWNNGSGPSHVAIKISVMRNYSCLAVHLPVPLRFLMVSDIFSIFLFFPSYLASFKLQ